MPDTEIELVPRADVHGRGDSKILGLKRHPLMDVETLRARSMRPPSVAIEARVEVNVTFDEAGNDQRIVEVDDIDIGRVMLGTLDRNDTAAADQHVAARAVGEARIGKESVGRHQVSILLVDCDLRAGRVGLPCLA